MVNERIGLVSPRAGFFVCDWHPASAEANQKHALARRQWHPARTSSLHGLLVLLLASLSLAAATGCDRAEQIAHYRVPKPVPLEPIADAGPQNPHAAGLGTQPAEPVKPAGEPTDRMLGAIVPLGEKFWFFKLMGSKDPVAAKTDEFLAFLKSVHFSAEGNPQWTLPEGWREQPGSAMRYATLVIPGDGKPLEVTVTVLPGASGALANVNRWRGQLSLPPITEEQLAGESTRIPLDGATATLVNLLGTAGPNSMGRPGFPPGARDGN